MTEQYETVYTSGVIGSIDKPNHTSFTGYCKNLFVDLDGSIRPHHFPKEGLWRFDGQIFYLPESEKQ